MANYPTTLPNFGSNVAAGDIILAGHINDIRAELIAIAKTLSAADSGTIDPANVIDTLLNAGYAAAINVAGINRVGGVLDVLASQLKQVLGDGWQTTPVINLIQLKAPNYLVGSTQANLPNSITLANIHRSGLLSARPAANTLPAGTFYFATDTGQMFRTDGSNWTTISSTPISGLANGDLIYWDGTKFVTVTAPVTTQPTYLQRIGNAYSFVTAAVGYNILASPSIYNKSTNIYEQFLTIQAAIDAVTIPLNQVVMIPPGTYYEKITLRANVQVQEILEGTVTIQYNGADALPTITIPAAECFLNIYRVIRGVGTGAALYFKTGGNLAGGSSIKYVHASSVTGNINCVEVESHTGVVLDTTFVNTVFSMSSSDNTGTIKNIFKINTSDTGDYYFINCIFLILTAGTVASSTINIFNINSNAHKIIILNPYFNFTATTGALPGTFRISYNNSTSDILLGNPIILGATKTLAEYMFGPYIINNTATPLSGELRNMTGTNISITDVQALTGLVLAQQTFI